MTDRDAELQRLNADLAALRAERDAALDAAKQQDALRSATLATMRSVSADRDRLAAELAEARKQMAALREFIAEFANAKINALRYSPPHGASPEDEPDPVVDAEEVWAWQADAKDTLAALPPPPGGDDEGEG